MSLKDKAGKMVNSVRYGKDAAEDIAKNKNEEEKKILARRAAIRDALKNGKVEHPETAATQATPQTAAPTAAVQDTPQAAPQAAAQTAPQRGNPNTANPPNVIYAPAPAPQAALPAPTTTQPQDFKAKFKDDEEEEKKRKQASIDTQKKKIRKINESIKNRIK